MDFLDTVQRIDGILGYVVAGYELPFGEPLWVKWEDGDEPELTPSASIVAFQFLSGLARQMLWDVELHVREAGDRVLLGHPALPAPSLL